MREPTGRAVNATATLLPLVALLLFSPTLPPTASGAQGPAPSPADEREVSDSRLRRARRYFTLYRFEQAEKLLRAALDQGGFDDRQREEAVYLHGRCLLELAGHDPDKILAAVTPLTYVAENRARLRRPRLAQQASYWIGRAYLLAGRYGLAAEKFARLAGLAENSQMDAEYRWYWARSLLARAAAVARDRGGDVPASEKFLREAVEQLRQITQVYENSPHYQDAELELMRIGFRHKQYAEVKARAKAFLQHGEVRGNNRAQALYFRGRSLMLTGELEEAIACYRRLLRVKEAEGRLRLQALVDLARAMYRVQRALGGEQGASYLRLARYRLEQALHLMPEVTPAKLEVLHLYCTILDETGRHQEVLELIDPLFKHPAWATRAHYLAGKACRGLGRFAFAIRHFSACLSRVHNLGPGRFQLEILTGLARMEEERGRFAAAALYHERAGKVARLLRDAASLAAADMGLARCLLGMQQLAAGGVPARDLCQALTRFAAGAGAPGYDPAGLAAAVSFQVRRRGLTARDAGRNLDLALAILQRLEQRHADRVRMDELAYEQGAALHAKARLRAAAVLAPRRLPRGDLEGVTKLYVRAIGYMQASARANPRGLWAPRASLGAGMVQADLGRFAFTVARRLRQAGDATTAGSYLEEGKKRLNWSLAPFRRAIKTARTDPELRLRARLLLGKAYMDLDDFAASADQFQALAGEPECPDAMRAEAVRLRATALERQGLRVDAIRCLRPDIGRYLRSTILAGRLLERQGLMRDAFATYSMGLAGNAEDASAGGLAAELEYRTWLLALEHARAIGREPTAVRTLERQAQERLQRLALSGGENGDKWPARALLALGEHYLAADNLRQARELIRSVAGLQRGGGLRPGVTKLALREQVLALLTGESEILAGRKQQARAAFTRLTTVAPDAPDPEMRALAARGFKALGDLARKEGKVREALRCYGEVVARFDDVEKLADAARVDMAGVYADQAQTLLRNREAHANARGLEQAARWLKRGLDLLAGGHDRERMLTARRRLLELERRLR